MIDVGFVTGPVKFWCPACGMTSEAAEAPLCRHEDPRWYSIPAYPQIMRPMPRGTDQP